LENNIKKAKLIVKGTGRRPKAALFLPVTRKGAQIRNYHVFTKMAPKQAKWRPEKQTQLALFR